MSRMSEEDIIIISENIKSNKTRLWCRVCNLILITSEDIERDKESGCCENCYITFVEGKSNAWTKKIQPDKETLKRYKLERSILNVKIENILGE